MDDFAPPSGPPPPKVPEGWTARWNEQYQEWFYVNLYTKKSQWEKPTEPIYPPPESELGGAPSHAPPTYQSSSPKPVGDEKKGHLGSNNPYATSQPDISEDERLARQLQEEENARAGGGRSPYPPPGGAATDFYNSAPPQQYGQQPPYGQNPYDGGHSVGEDKGKGKSGLLGKIMGKVGGSSSHSKPQYGGYGGYGHGPQYGHQPYGHQPQYGHGYGGYPPHGAYGSPYGGHGYGHAPKKSGGLGTAGGVALGAGAGLLGGALIADAIDDHEDAAYAEGYDDGADGGDFDGGDFGGGDF